MSEIVPKDSRYLPMTQQDSCCAPTCISIIMYKHKIPLLPQELLGYHLGLIVSKEDKKLFWNPRTGKRPPSGYGTQVYKKEYSPNAIFPKLGIPLKMTYHPISAFTKKSYEEFLVQIPKQNKDVLTCFDHGELKGNHVQGGHLCVVDRVDINKKTIRLIDPSPKQPKWRVVPIEKLRKAMEFHGDDKSGGFWEFKYVGKKK